MVVLIDWDQVYGTFSQQPCDRGVFLDINGGSLDERVIVAGYTGGQEDINATVVGEDPAQFLEYIGCVALTPNSAVPWVYPPDGV